MLGRLDGLEPDEGDLHGAEEADDEEGVVRNVDPLAESVHEDKDEDVQRNQIDDKHVAAPSGNLKLSQQ